ncbi:MAG: hypothetical protein IK007_10250 [Lachnospiraceae bacterium]|jgi:hypothetical protein|nr:hypothetical protein [Lachnospiraceae bacterium]MCR4625246.1 hypothetical protein [Lachnospiraceae bacterium]
MLNERKIRLMTQLAIYEKKEGKEDVKLSKFYKSDYARFQAWKTGVAVTVAYLLLVAVAVIYKLEYLIENAFNIDYALLGKKILGLYIIVLATYVIVAMLGYSLKYAASRKKLARYFRMLRKLNHIYLVEDGIVQEDEEK